jgi:nitroreductase
MDFFDLVNKRRSVRKFTKTKVSEAVMRKCLKASLLAPNSSNLQPW